MAAEPIQIRSSASAPASSGGCACGHHAEEELVLDTRQIPHAIRHATIFGALDSLGMGISLDLVANHNPLPLLAQLEGHYGEAVEITYRQREPGAIVIDFKRL